MEKVVFLDRDGTLNEEVHYLHKPEDLRILEGVPEALRLLSSAGFKIVVVTNQAGVARGYYTCEEVEALHEYFNELLAKEGAHIDKFFYCPHHSVHGIGEYKKECSCRKPGTGMFLEAEQYFQVDKEHSYMIGDKLLDVEAGKNYGIQGILVGTGYGAEIHRKLLEEESDLEAGKEPYYDFYAETLMDAARYIVEREG